MPTISATELEELAIAAFVQADVPCDDADLVAAEQDVAAASSASGSIEQSDGAGAGAPPPSASPKRGALGFLSVCVKV